MLFQLLDHVTMTSVDLTSRLTLVTDYKLTPCNTQYLASLQNQFTLLNDLPPPSDNLSPIENLVLNNYKILHSTKSNNYNILAFLEALLIKHNKPFLNTGLKASKELQPFT